jgi:dienelactone hydrolase
MIRLALAALLAVSSLARADMQAVPIDWQHQDVEFRGYLVYDDAGPPRPGLLMVPNWMGVNESALEKARAVAETGYVVLVVDMYGRDLRPADSAAAQAAVRPLYADRNLLRGRINRALEVLRGSAGRAPLQADRIAAFGFCFGGAVVLELARSGADVAGVVSLHGSLDTSMPAEPGQVRASVLVLNGADDRAVSQQQVVGLQDELTAAGVDWQFVNFSGAVHCFAEADAQRPPNCLYHERSAKRAYRMMENFFDEVL